MPKPLAHRLILVIGLLALTVSGCGEPSSPIRVVLVTVDTWRLDALRPQAMPRLTARSAQGLVFARAYAAVPATQPTHASLLTGLHPWDHGVTRNSVVLPERVVTIAEALAARGWDTAAVVSSHPLDPKMGFAQGFGRYDARFDHVWTRTRARYALARSTTDRALALLAETTADRQFLWVHYFDPHDPYGDRDAATAIDLDALREVVDDEEALHARLAPARRGYAEDIADLDVEIDRLIAGLEAGSRELHWIVTSDHGESFGESGAIGHGTELTVEQVHVPLVVSSPRVAAGVRREPAGSVDVAATLLDLAEARGAVSVSGRTLLGAARPRIAVGMRTSGMADPDGLRIGGGKIDLSERLFFLADDQGLRTGRPQDDELFAAFTARLDGVRAEETADAELREQLKALGYLD